MESTIAGIHDSLRTGRAMTHPKRRSGRCGASPMRWAARCLGHCLPRLNDAIREFYDAIQGF
jgi:hypothetical protein